MEENEIRLKVTDLEKKKGELIERIKYLNKRLRHKKYEHKALEPYVEKTKDVKIFPLKKKKKALEFRIATQAYTPKMEKEWLKEVRKVDDELAKVREIEWARRKKKLVEQDITEADKEVQEIETQLKTIRAELKELYSSIKAMKEANKSGVKIGGFEDDMVSMEDLVQIEDSRKQK